MNDSIENHPSGRKLFISFLRLGLTAFGGPAMIAYIREMAVDRHKWLDAQTFKDGVVLCQSVPGATAMQAAAYVGMKAGGVPGALLSYIGFGLPAFIFMMILSSLYVAYHGVPKVASLFTGLQVLVCAVVANATWTFGRSTFNHYEDVAFAVTAAVLFWVGVSPFIIIVGAALVGILFPRSAGNIPSIKTQKSHGRRYVKEIAALLLLMIAALLALNLIDRKLFSLAALMMKIDLFAFGGGFASIPLMLHEVVGVRRWMDNRTFMDGIVLGQVTPGPIVITSTFVGYLTHRIAGALVATAAMFTPSFFMVIVLSPIMDKLKSSAYFLKATRGIVASFVGLLLFVTFKFSSAVHWDILKAFLGLLVLIALLKKVDMVYVVLASAVLSVFLF